MRIQKNILRVFFAAAAAVFTVVIGFDFARAANPPQIARDLAPGSIGEDVRSLQKFLNDGGYVLASSGAGSPGNESTIFGLRTKNALMNFQTANGIIATGVFDSATRAFVSGATGAAGASILAQIELLHQKIAQLQQELAGLLADAGEDDGGGDKEPPRIVSIVVSDGGDKEYIDGGDTIRITFSEAIDPKSINGNLDEGNYVNNVPYSQTGGVNALSTGAVTVNGIAAFDAGAINGTGTFSTRIALNSAGDVLTVTLIGGAIEIKTEDFSGASQTGGAVKDLNGNAMESGASIGNPQGTFGGGGDAPRIVSIVVSDGGDKDYIDIGDSIEIAFNETIDPKSINDNLDYGAYVTGIGASQIGGVSVTDQGRIMVQGIARFDAGQVSGSGNFTSKIALDGGGSVITITLTGGSDVGIGDEEFGNAVQIGGAVEDPSGNVMESVSGIADPQGTFGGDDIEDDENPHIVYIAVYNGDDSGYIDIGDMITVTFSEAIDPKSINGNLDEGNYVNNVPYSRTGGASVTAQGLFVIQNIAKFDVGTVEDSQEYISKVALNSAGDVLTITLTGGGGIEIYEESFEIAAQTGDTVEDLNGNIMEHSSVAEEPSGSF